MVSAVPIQQSAPWEAVSAQEQLFVLITGANSGIGLGIAQRLIDEFIATRSLTSHITIIPTARSASKCLQTIRTLRAYATQAAQTSEVLRARAGGQSEYNWKDTVARVHILSLSLELCDLRNIYAFADALCNGTVSNPEGLEGEYLRNVHVPRIDSVIFNAAYGGWSGVDYPGAIWSVLTKGIVETATYPDFKTALATGILNEDSRLNYPEKPLLAEVFCACVFGHYLLAHQLVPLLSRRKDEQVAPGRIIWSSSLEAHAKTFEATDLQCFTRSFSYESAKRLTDLLVLTCTLPAVQPYSKSFLTIGRQLDDSESDATEDDDFIPPNMYLTHPGIVASTLFPLPWFLFWAYELVVSLARWLGSPWHLTSGYMGGKSAAWVALQEQSELDAMQATRLKFGSACDRSLTEYVKPTEAEGWGWNGKVESSAGDTTSGVLNRLSGRKQGAKDVTEEDIANFEVEGAYCWAEMEKLRLQWEDILAEEGI